VLKVWVGRHGRRPGTSSANTDLTAYTVVN